MCIIAIEGCSNYSELTETFNSYIERMEEQVFERNNQNELNFNDTAHRLQFATINLRHNPKFRKQVMSKVTKKNPRYMVYISEKDLLGVFNNIQDLEFVLEDAIHGEYDELQPITNYIDASDNLQDLFFNESLSFFKIVFYHLTTSFWIRVCFFVVMVLTLNQGFNIDSNRAMVISLAMLAVWVLWVIMRNLFTEDIL